jgi:hypothetical protein
VTYKFWLGELIRDATSENLSHVVGRLGPDDLRTLYEQGSPPSIDGIIRHCENTIGRRIGCREVMK